MDKSVLDLYIERCTNPENNKCESDTFHNIMQLKNLLSLNNSYTDEQKTKILKGISYLLKINVK